MDSPGFDWIEYEPIIKDPHSLVSYVPRFPLFVHMVSAIFCLGCSAIYHLFKDYDPRVNHYLARMDYAGISMLIAGSNTPPIWYAFFCEENHFYRDLFLGIQYLACFMCFVVLLVPKFDKPKYIPLRGTMFVLCGLLAVFMFNFIVFYMEQRHIGQFSAFPWAFGGALYILGAIIYMLKIPEKCRPHKHDFVGSSHQIFHFFIIVAVLVHYNASINMFHNRQLYQCPVPALENFLL